MRLSGSVDQPTEPQRRCSKSYKKATTVAVGLEPSVAELQEHLAALTRELSEAREQQTATANVLKIIGRSTYNLQTVLDTLTESAARLCEADMAGIAWQDGSSFRNVNNYNFPPDCLEITKSIQLKPGRGSVVGRALLESKPVQVADVFADPEYTLLELAKKSGYRTFLAVPLLREENALGVIVLTRKTVAPFTDEQIELATTFADQAVIAIENVRLFEAEQRQTRELSQALERQTATAEVLNVISRSTFQLQPVLDAIVQTASRLCNAETAVILMFREEKLHLVATSNASSAFVQHALEHPLTPGRGSITGRTFLERQTVHLPDCLADPEYTLRDFQAIGQHRSMLGVPLLREGSPIGVITLWRTVVLAFTETEIDLVKTFADQAVIAIENARLFEEVQARTRELTKSLQQQTATADVLQVISRSAFDLQPVFDTVAESSVRLCDAERAFIRRYDGELLHMVAAFNSPPELKEWLARHPFPPGRHSCAARVALEHRTVHIPDVRADPEFSYGAKDVEPILGGTALGVPMLKGNDLLGVIIIDQVEVRPFTDKQIALVETFADQSAIAIENVRLFEEVQQRTRDLSESLEQQTATAEVLKVISSSPGELEPVFDAILENAVQICGAKFGVLVLFEGDSYRRVALHNAPAAYVEAKARDPVRPLAKSPLLSRVATTKQVIQVTDRPAT